MTPNEAIAITEAMPGEAVRCTGSHEQPGKVLAAEVKKLRIRLRKVLRVVGEVLDLESISRSIKQELLCAYTEGKRDLHGDNIPEQEKK